jgi:hypothetical protein
MVNFTILTTSGPPEYSNRLPGRSLAVLDRFRVDERYIGIGYRRIPSANVITPKSPGEPVDEVCKVIALVPECRGRAGRPGAQVFRSPPPKTRRLVPRSGHEFPIILIGIKLSKLLNRKRHRKRGYLYSLFLIRYLIGKKMQIGFEDNFLGKYLRLRRRCI